VSLRVLVVSNDHVGTKMAGPGIRSWEFAHELAKRFEVTLCVPHATDLTSERLRIVRASPYDPAELRPLTDTSDVVVAQRLPPWTMARLARRGTRTIYDLYAPTVVENLAFGAERQQSAALRLLIETSEFVESIALRTGNAFICASERQRDFWLGALAAVGRIGPRYRDDPALRELIDVVPFGIPETPPEPGEPVLKGTHGIDGAARVLLWGGGIWNWLDPLTVIRAVARLARERDDVRLYFLGLKHPHPEAHEMVMTQRAIREAEDLGLRDKVVFFNFGWVPYAERGRYLAEADLGVAAHFETLETRLAFRTRIVDYIWAGLPIVASAGDVLAEAVAAEDLGRVVSVQDVDGWVAALTELLDNPDAYATSARNARAAAARFRWPDVVQPLVRLVEGSGEAVEAPQLGANLARYYGTRLRLAFGAHGTRGMAERALSRARRIARRATSTRQTVE
jgi:glycosyltransferase involved in cell wall biosynthesis